jgi:hypothetical protein
MCLTFFSHAKQQHKEKSSKMKPPLKPVSGNVVEDKKAAYEAAKNSALVKIHNCIGF